MKKINLLTLALLLFGAGVFAQTNFFQRVGAGQLPQARNAVQQVKSRGIFKLNEKGLRDYLFNAPMEFKNNGVTLPLEIPLPNGKTEVFNIVESPVLSPAIAAANPDIKTYTGNGQRDKKSVIRLSLTSRGFNAIILNVEGDAVYFESYSKSKSDIYYNYFVRDVLVPKSGAKKSPCGLGPNEERRSAEKLIINKANALQHRNSAALSTGGTLTTYRLAMPADAEFVAQNGGNVDDGFDAVVTYVNRIDAFYRNELSVSFTLVSGKNMIYINAATDPYTNDDQIAMLDENQTNCDAIIGNANYDIGHVWGYVGSSGGGVASRPSVCDDGGKARGVSGEGDLTTYTQAFMDQLVFHEIGHQFNMSHSYNSSIPVCTTREPSTSVEPGSGATVMSYGFTCSDNTGNDDYPSDPVNGLITGPILQFHTVSYQQAVAYIATAGCGTTSATGNTAPVVVMPSNFTIPKSTPFALTGSATDANTDALTYCWEGTNIGTMVPTAATLANTAQPPFFRSYSPSTSPTRIYPAIESILDGSNYAIGDKLPSVGIATKHNLTVRDNNSAGGGVTFGSVTVTVNGSIGPFLETTNLSGTYAGLSSKTITWNVNGTNAATPNVKISLSTDGGFTFPTVLLASTPNDGTQSVTLPNITTTTARIKVEAVGNIFFDISNANFSINASGATFTITASSGANGSVTPSGAVNVASGANQTFAITPNACYQIATVLVDGVNDPGAVSSGSYTFTNVTANHTINATFSKITYNITSSAGANGSITPNGTSVVGCGDNKTFSITPASGFSIKDVLVDGVSAGSINSKTFTNVTANHTISATFIVSSGCVKPKLSASISNVKCNGSSTGAINLSVSAGTAPYTYAWRLPGPGTATTQDITGLVAGNYYVVVTAAGGCVDSAKYVVSQPTALKISLVSKSDVSCKGGDDGYIKVVATGGTAPYTYRIHTQTTFQSSGYFGNRVKRTYAITAKDKNGCTVDISNIVIKDGTKKCAANSQVITSSTEAIKHTVDESLLKADIFPNPAKAQFTLKLNSNSTDPVQISVMDIYGRPILKMKGPANQYYKFGQNFIPGAYLVQILQGNTVKTLKVIKN